MGLLSWIKKHTSCKAVIPIGPVKLEVDSKKVKVDIIDIIESPIAGCEGGKISPPLKVRLNDVEGYPVKSKSVHIEFYDDEGLMSTRLISGNFSKLSDVTGTIIFDDIIVKKTGNITILLCVDGVEATSESIQILPPGLELDFWNELVGSPEYEKKFDRAIQFSNGS